MKRSFLISLALVWFALPSPAQQAAKSKSDIGSIGKYEVNIFGGGSFFRQQDDAPRQRFEDGGTAGFRINQNYWNFWGIEEQFRVHGANNVRYEIPGGTQSVAFGSRTRGFSLGPLFYFTPRDSRFRPFLKAGAGFNWFGPTEDGRKQAAALQGLGLLPLALTDQTKAAFNYGGGVKWKLNRFVGLRFDLEGVSHGRPTLGIPVVPAGTASGIPNPRTGVINFSSDGGVQNSLNATAGLTFYMGDIATGAPGEWNVGQIEGSATSAWEGDPLNFKLPLTNTFEGVTPSYKWFVNNQPVTGALGDVMKMVAGKPGSYEIKAIAEADTTKAKGRVLRWLRKNPIAATARTATVTVKDWPAPIITSSGANPPAITAPKPPRGTTDGTPVSVSNAGTSTINARIGGFERPREITYTFTTPEGRLTPGQTAGGTVSQPDPRTVIVTVKDVKPGDTPNVTVIFTPEGITVPAGSSKTIPIGIKVKDSHGPETSATAQVRISVPRADAPPPPPPSLEAIQLDDIIFASGRSRVNNCAKRILDQAYERAMANGDYEVVLVSHVDERESRIRHRTGAKTLEQQRAYNAAAFLTAGTQPCHNLEASRIKIVMAGTDQSNPSKALLCQSSTNERAADRVRTNDENAAKRRVEVWLVPRPGKGKRPNLQYQDVDPAMLPTGCPQ
jgi:outer membrane protein OmpA-like peptidoglycan-associated protein/opacity protein-like surface antigen